MKWIGMGCALCWLVTGGLQAGERGRVLCHTRQTARQEQRVVVGSGLVVVPFAVPVGVPVATFVRPSVVYGYDAGRMLAVDREARLGEDVVGPHMDRAEQVLRRRCVACHAGAEAAGGVRLFDESGALLSRLPRWRVWESVESGKMPEGGERLTSEELEWIRNWAKPPPDVVY